MVTDVPLAWQGPAAVIVAVAPDVLLSDSVNEDP
jgi:hypothetical protein